MKNIMMNKSQLGCAQLMPAQKPCADVPTEVRSMLLVLIVTYAIIPLFYQTNKHRG